MTETPPAKLSKPWIIGLALLAIYLPQSWVFLMDYPWNGYHWLWIKLWPALPGVVLYFFIGRVLPQDWLHKQSEASLYVYSSLLTLTFLIVVFFILFRLVRGFWPAMIALAAVSGIFGFLAYSLMRA